MKTAKQVLIEHDVLQDAVNGMPDRIISIDPIKFISAMKEYAKEAIWASVELVEKESWAEDLVDPMGYILSRLSDKIENLEEQLK